MQVELALSRIHAASSSHLDTTTSPMALASENTRQVILIHEISLLPEPSLFFCSGLHILFLIFRENKAGSPSSLATTALPFAAGAAMHRFRDTVFVSSSVPLHVLLQMHLELSTRIRRARDSGESVLSTSGTELLAHVLRGSKACMAAFDVCLEVLNPL